MVVEKLKETIKIRMQGHCRGCVDGMPATEGGYQSARQGGSSFFRISSWPTGHEFESEGKLFRVTLNKYSKGDAWFVSTYRFEAEEI